MQQSYFVSFLLIFASNVRADIENWPFCLHGSTRVYFGTPSSTVSLALLPSASHSSRLFFAPKWHITKHAWKPVLANQSYLLFMKEGICNTTDQGFFCFCFFLAYCSIYFFVAIYNILNQLIRLQQIKLNCNNEFIINV